MKCDSCGHELASPVETIRLECPECGKFTYTAGAKRIVENLLSEMLTLVFWMLTQAEENGLSLKQATWQLEDAIQAQYGIPREAILGLMAGARRMEKDGS